MKETQQRAGATQRENEYAAAILAVSNQCDYFAAQYEQLRLQVDDLVNQSGGNSQQQGIGQIQRQMDVLREQTETLSRFLWNTLDVNDCLTKELEAQEKICARQKLQLGCLEAQNRRYRRAIDRVTGTWYGKIALKAYHFLQRKNA